MASEGAVVGVAPQAMSDPMAERCPRFHTIGVCIFALLLVYLVGVLIWTLSTGVSFSIPQWLVVALLFLPAVLGLAWQVRCLVVALRAGDR
ncbi:hypothetical protein AYL44_03595 [Microbacterium oleivorans]|uniref:Uncharacterized protein n=1 Tax=Microbacterium oleivorans TaxID=273677 RepID=A0A177KD72_9MICO|nr:hypothetical protein AYL44_03595 [Microbacterium oleivorans]